MMRAPELDEARSWELQMRNANNPSNTLTLSIQAEVTVLRLRYAGLHWAGRGGSAKDPRNAAGVDCRASVHAGDAWGNNSGILDASVRAVDVEDDDEQEGEHKAVAGESTAEVTELEGEEDEELTNASRQPAVPILNPR